jgi:hypothetical protein
MLKAKKTSVLAALVLTGSAVLIAAHQSPSFAASATASVLCASTFSGSYPAEADWRKATTQISSEMSSTSAAREKEIAARQKKMEDEVLGQGAYAGHGDTPPIELFAEDGVKMTFLSHTDGTSGVPTKIVLSNVGSSGVLRATMLVPVSGHTGAANARAWSTTDTFSLTTDVSQDKNGTQWGGNHSESASEKPLVTDVKSLGLVTSQEVSVQLSKDHVTRVLYYRSGSGGPGGYWDGRVIELVWDGT